MPLVLITAPAAEPLDLDEAQEHLRVEEPADLSYILSLITAARQHVESWTGRALVTQTWELVLDEFPHGVFELAKGRVQAVESVAYVDPGGAHQTLATSSYQVDLATESARLAPFGGGPWPATADRLGAVHVRFVAGYGDASSVPQPIKQAMLLLIGHLFEHRESEISGTITSTWHFAVESLLTPYRLRWVG